MVPVGMPPLGLLVFVVGTGSLGAEIAGVRLLAPYFGASTIVWANTIAVVLVALSAGYWLGGKLGDRRPDMRSMCSVALAAAVLLALVPFVADPLLDVAVDALNNVSAGAFIGSLFAVLVLLAVPVLLLGMISPWALRLGMDQVENAGTIAGRLYALSTAGSLIGTLLSALLLIPAVGTRRTFLLFALAIGVVAVLGLRPVKRFAAVPLAIALLMLLPAGTLKAAGEGERLLEERDTEYQYARVVERADGSRVLELNEGQAYHSIWRPDSPLTGGVWDGHLFLPFARLDAPPRRVAVLGNAAGSVARAYEALFPRTRIDGVEIDAELSELGRRWFAMDNPRLELFHEDARPFLDRMDVRYDVISVDAYRQPYIPFYLTTREFFELVRDRLTPGGLVIVNAGHPEGQDELEKVLGRTMRAVFPHTLRDPIAPENTLLLGSREPMSAGRLRDAAERLPAALRGPAAAASGRLGPQLPGGAVYTDDHAPVEWLIDRSILEYAAEE